jgi:hypothetical protein
LWREFPDLTLEFEVHLDLGIVLPVLDAREFDAQFLCLDPTEVLQCIPHPVDGVVERLCTRPHRGHLQRKQAERLGVVRKSEISVMNVGQ